jgi:hypothetical protein
MKRMLTVRSKKKGNGREMFENISKTKLSARRHYCRFCDEKRNDTNVDKTSDFIVSTPNFQAV